VRPAPAAISATATGVRLQIRLQPRASRNEIVGPHGDQLRLRLTAPPVEGAANEALVRFLAEQLGVERSAVKIVAGLASRSKVVDVGSLQVTEAARRLGLAP
jgi:uncharacterized protein (TIGR00251 family)